MATNSPKISICVPCYEMRGKGIPFLKDLLSSVLQQTYKNIEIIISDHSISDDIEKWSYEIMMEMKQKDIQCEYFRYEDQRGCCSANLNNAIKMASGSVIAPLFQDDFFYSDDCLQNIADALEKNPNYFWGASGFIHTDENITGFYGAQSPIFNKNTLIGHNTVGCPSVIFFKNTTDQVFFDTNLIWLMDCEFYHNLYTKFGKPLVIEKTQVGIRVWNQSVTKEVSDIIKLGEE